MGLHEDFQRAIRQTEIRRWRESALLTTGQTDLPYILLSESEINVGDTVVRKGMVHVEKPQIMVVSEPPVQFEGFEYEDNPSESGAFMALGRIASFPPGKYSNIANEMKVYEGPLSQAIEHYTHRLNMGEDLTTGLVVGPVDIWALSLFIYVGSIMMQSASNDIQEFMRRQMPPGFGHN